MKSLKKFKLNGFYVPSILSGVLLFLSFPKIDLYLLSWIALIPLLVFLYGKDKKTAFKAGLLCGVIYFFGTIYWIYYAIHRYGSMPFLPSLLIVLLLSFYLSLYTAIFSVLYSSYIKKSELPAMFIAPVFWTVLEFLRSYAFTGFPWSSLGYSQYKFLSFIQIADIIGVYGISFLIVAFNGAIADLFLYRKRKNERPLLSPMPTISGFIVLTLLLITTFSYGIYRLTQDRQGYIVKVAIIQGSIEQDKKWEPLYQNEVIQIYKELSIAASQFKPDIIVWPETAVPFYFAVDKELTKLLMDFQKKLDSYLLFGSILQKSFKKNNSQTEEIGYTNSAVLLDKNGNISYVYDKIHLVPFGEYVPLRKLLFFVEKLAYGIGDYKRGHEHIKAVTPFGSFATLICYEIIFPGLVRKFFTKDGDFIITITNDAWFGDTHGPHQHFSMAVLRAIENRKPIIRAANTGISGYIDSSGRILSTTDLFKRTLLVKEIKTDATKTFYTKYGDMFSYLCIVCSVLLLIKRI